MKKGGNKGCPPGMMKDDKGATFVKKRGMKGLPGMKGMKGMKKSKTI